VLNIQELKPSTYLSMPGDHRGDPIIPQTEPSNVEVASPSTNEGLRPRALGGQEPVQHSTQRTDVEVLTSGLVVSLAFVELPLGLIKADHPSYKTAFNVYIFKPPTDILSH
jgi:hypothetical protein